MAELVLFLQTSPCQAVDHWWIQVLTGLALCLSVAIGQGVGWNNPLPFNRFATTV